MCVLLMAGLVGLSTSDRILTSYGIDWPSAAEGNEPKITLILKDNLSHNVIAHLKQAQHSLLNILCDAPIWVRALALWLVYIV